MNLHVLGTRLLAGHKVQVRIAFSADRPAGVPDKPIEILMEIRTGHLIVYYSKLQYAASSQDIR